MKGLTIDQKQFKKQIDILEKYINKNEMNNEEILLYDGLINLLCTISEED